MYKIYKRPNKVIELQKEYNINNTIKIPKGAKFKILGETENGYKLKYLGILPNLNYAYDDIYYLAKHWFGENKENKSLNITQIYYKLKNSGYDKEDINDILKVLQNE